VSLRAYDVSGRVVTEILEGHLGAGPHTVPWSVEGVRSGVYFCRLRAVSSDTPGEETQTRSIIVLH
jgi:hypothetical protein